MVQSLVVKKVVFIMGAGHCGSTLLDLLLGSHSTGFSLAEFRLISGIVDGSRRETPTTCAICAGECEFWDKRVSMNRLAQIYSTRNLLSKIKGKAFRFFRNPYSHLFEASQKSMLIDSSKNPAWFRRQIKPHHVWKTIAPYLIYLKRDGRAVVNSYYRKYPRSGVEKLTRNWINSCSAMNDFYLDFALGDKCVVHYEALAQRPEATLRNLGEFLQAPFEKEMLLYWCGDHHPIAGNGGTQSLIFKYRESLGEQPAHQKKYYDKQYYEDIGLAIQYDERWRVELGEAELAAFNQIAGDFNKDFIHARPDQ